MNSHRYVPRLAGTFAAIALAATLAACGGSPSSSGSGAHASTSPATSAPGSTTSPASSPGAGSGQVATITRNWEAFFNAKTPVNQRIALLQDGSQFASVIRSQAGSGLAALATAKVTQVVVSSPAQAKVTYNILVSGTPELKNQSGVAVLQNGTWKVGVDSFCGLLVLENAGKKSGLPAACKTAT